MISASGLLSVQLIRACMGTRGQQKYNLAKGRQMLVVGDTSSYFELQRSHRAEADPQQDAKCSSNQGTVKPRCVDRYGKTTIVLLIKRPKGNWFK